MWRWGAMGVITACSPGDPVLPTAQAPEASTSGTTGGRVDETGTPVANTNSSGDTATSDGSPTGPETTTFSVSTTGPDDAWCNGFTSPSADAPWLTIANVDGEAFGPGNAMHLECGLQGGFMFALYPEFGGFVPDEEFIPILVEVNVDGFSENTFFSTVMNHFIGCGELGAFPFLPIFPPDSIDDLETLDGANANVRVVLLPDELNVEVTFSATLRAQDDGSWETCAKYGG